MRPSGRHEQPVSYGENPVRRLESVQKIR